MPSLAAPLGLRCLLCVTAAEAVWTFDWRTEGKGQAGLTRAGRVIHVCRAEGVLRLFAGSFFPGSAAVLTHGGVDQWEEKFPL